MPKKCPPGVICIENVTLFILAILFSIIAYFVYLYFQDKNQQTSSVNNSSNNFHLPQLHTMSSRHLPLHQDKTETLLDPYAPPLKPNQYLHNNVQKGVAINVPTQGPIPDYRQIGILTRNTHKDTILPLFGRPLLSNRDKWQYYTMNDKSNAIKLPISINGKSCTSEYGCNSLYSGDNVYVEGYNDIFDVTVYDTNTVQYIPVV